MLIYVIICCPQGQGGQKFMFVYQFTFVLYNCILFCIFSCFFGGRVKFDKFVYILALCMFICLCKFEIIQYILKYISVFAFVFCHTILTEAQNTQMAYLSIIPECYIVYLVVFPLCASPGGCFIHSLGDVIQIVHPIEVYLLKQ